MLLHQGLYLPRKLEGKDGILYYFKRVGSIQFDPLDKVGWNPDLVLQSRINKYKPVLLQELLYTDRKLLDGWDKNKSIYRVEDWPYFARYRERARDKYSERVDIKKIIPEIREKISDIGPLSSIDLKFNTKVDWSWAPTRAARAALTSMYEWGELIVHHRIGTRMVYDFTDNNLADDILSAPDPNKSEKEYYKWHVKRRIGSIGMVWDLSGSAWLGIRGLKKKERSEAISRLVEAGDLISIEVEGSKYLYFIRKEEEGLLKRVVNETFPKESAAIIAPLDNLLWDRSLIEEIFNFDYVWEVYKPVSERKYGYYVLPILYGDRFIARFEPEFDRDKKALIIKDWWWEPGVKPTEKMQKALSVGFKQFLEYLSGERIKDESEKQQLEWLADINI